MSELRFSEEFKSKLFELTQFCEDCVCEDRTRNILLENLEKIPEKYSNDIIYKEIFKEICENCDVPGKLTDYIQMNLNDFLF